MGIKRKGGDRVFEVEVFITFKEGLVDPQGIAIKEALEALGYDNVSDVHMGKYIRIKLNTQDREKAESELKEMCAKLLSNPVIENYRYEILEKALK